MRHYAIGNGGTNHRGRRSPSKEALVKYNELGDLLRDEPPKQNRHIGHDIRDFGEHSRCFDCHETIYDRRAW